MRKVEWKSCFRIGAMIFVLYLLTHYWDRLTTIVYSLLSAATPLLVGCLIAYLVNILMSFYEAHYFTQHQTSAVLKSRRPVCMILAFTSLLLIVIGISYLIVPELVSSAQLLALEIPPALEKLMQTINERWDFAALLADYPVNWDTIDWKSLVKNGLDWLTRGFGGMMGTVMAVVSATFSTLFTLLLSFIFSLYLLSGKEKLGGQVNRLMKHYLKPNWNQKIHYVIDVLHDCFHRFIVGQCLEAVILGALCTLGMLLFRFPYANMVGALVGFTALIPVAGAYIGAGVGAFMVFTVAPMRALFFLIFIIVLQQLEGNLIYPRVVGASIGLPGVWVLAAITIGGSLSGIGGMLLGVPLAAACYRLLRADLNRRNEESVVISTNPEEFSKNPQQMRDST